MKHNEKTKEKEKEKKKKKNLFPFFFQNKKIFSIFRFLFLFFFSPSFSISTIMVIPSFLLALLAPRWGELFWNYYLFFFNFYLAILNFNLSIVPIVSCREREGFLPAHSPSAEHQHRWSSEDRVRPDLDQGCGPPLLKPRLQEGRR